MPLLVLLLALAALLSGCQSPDFSGQLSRAVRKVQAEAAHGDWRTRYDSGRLTEIPPNANLVAILARHPAWPWIYQTRTVTIAGETYIAVRYRIADWICVALVRYEPANALTPAGWVIYYLGDVPRPEPNA